MQFFAHLLRKEVLIFTHEILTYTEHELQLQKVFQLLTYNHLYLEISKCSFAQTSLEYLGHVIRVQVLQLTQ
jgi:hypothetical protein